MPRELLIGCGNGRDKLVSRTADKEWSDVVTCDIDPNCGADHEIDLNRCNLAEVFGAESFDEIHGYHVLEHCGTQGDYRFFFRQWADFYKVLKPGGIFCGIVPMLPSGWCWADPGHTRVIAREFHVFLDQAEYQHQVGRTALADYRHIWKGDFQRVFEKQDHAQHQFWFVLEAIKPAGDGMASRLERKAKEPRDR